MKGKYVVSTHNGTTDGGFSGQLGGNYYCREDTPLPFKNAEKDFKVESSFQDMRIEPFVDKKDGYAFDFNGEY